MNLLLAAVLLVQDKGSEGIYRQMKESIEKSKSITIEFTALVEQKTNDSAIRVECSGSVAIKDSEKLRLKMNIVQEGQTGRLDTTCDGKRLRSENTGRVQEREAPKEMVPNMIAGFSREAVFSTSLLSPRIKKLRMESGKSVDVDFKRDFVVSDFSFGADAGSWKTLNYTLTIPEQQRTYLGCIFYDPKTLLPGKRTLSVKEVGFEETFTETYGKFSLDADIPDEKFKLPEEKK